MTKDQIAVYLNEHLEFFNDYPELLEKVHAIKKSDLPLEPLGTLSIADRIIKRVQDDKEHIKSQFEWIMEIVKANENIQGQLYEIERLVLSSANLPQMLAQLQQELSARFAIEQVVVCLVDHSEHLIENKLEARFGKEQLDGILIFAGQDEVANWFGKERKPILRSEIKGNSVIFGGEKFRGKVNSEALLPLILRGEVVGAIGLGCGKPFRFYPELRTEYLERLTDKMALVIDNMLLLDLLKRQPLIDSETGFYSQAFLDPILLREFDRAQRYKKSLICVKMRIDYFADLINTGSGSGDEPAAVGKILKDNCRASDLVIRSAPVDAALVSPPNVVRAEEIVVLLPEIGWQDAVKVAERVCKTLEAGSFIADGKRVNIAANIGVAAYPGDSQNHKELLAAASQDLARAIKVRNSPITLAG